MVVEEEDAEATEVATEVTQDFLHMAVAVAGSFFLSLAPQSDTNAGQGSRSWILKRTRTSR